MSELTFHSDLEHLCRHVEIQDSRFVIAGEELPIEPTFDRLGLPSLEQEVQNRMLESLSSRLYKAFYVRALSKEEAASPSSLGITEAGVQRGEQDTDLVAQLKLANGVAEAWDPGWQIYHFGNDGRAYVKRGDQSRIAWAGTYMLDTWMGSGAKIGDTVKLKVFPYTESSLDFFFHTFGATLSDQFDEYKLLRFYFNVRANAVVDLLRFLSAQLNYYLVPYHFKAIADCTLYDRADAAVLYVASCHYQIAAQILPSLPNLLGDGLRTAVPMFTRTWAPGIGAAQDPGNGASFGLHRCRLVAQALLQAWAQQTCSVEDKMDLIARSFTEAGIALQTPYLNRGEYDIFAQPIFTGGVNR